MELRWHYTVVTSGSPRLDINLFTIREENIVVGFALNPLIAPSPYVRPPLFPLCCPSALAPSNADSVYRYVYFALRR